MSKFEKTEMICPECGEEVFKHFHRHDDYITQTFDWRHYWCKNMCNLGCNNCISVDTHGDCCAEFCYNKSNWTPVQFKNDKLV